MSYYMSAISKKLNTFNSGQMGFIKGHPTEYQVDLDLIINPVISVYQEPYARTTQIHHTRLPFTTGPPCYFYLAFSCDGGCSRCGST